MKKVKDAPQDLSDVLAELVEMHEDALSRALAIEELLEEHGLISAKDVQRRAKSFRKRFAADRKKQMQSFLKRLLDERRRRQRQMLDKPVGPVQ